MCEASCIKLVACDLSFVNCGSFALIDPKLLITLHLRRTTSLATDSVAVTLSVGDSSDACRPQRGISLGRCSF